MFQSLRFVGGMTLLAALYMTGFYALADHQNETVRLVSDGMMIGPRIRHGGEIAEVAFRPAIIADQFLRPYKWRFVPNNPVAARHVP